MMPMYVNEFGVICIFEWDTVAGTEELMHGRVICGSQDV